MAVEALDLEDVFLVFFNGVGVSTRCRGVVATTLSPFSAALRTLLVILVLLVGLTLISGLPTRHVSRRRMSGLSLSGVFLLLLSGPIPSETS